MPNFHVPGLQAAGAVFTAVMSAWDECACGWLWPAVLSLFILWVLCLPAGLIFLVALHKQRATAAGKIRFHRPAGAGSWTAYAAHVYRSRGDPANFARPAVVHAILRSALAAGGAVCGHLGLRAATARDVVSAAALAATSAVLSFAASKLASSLGRRVVVAATNLLAAKLRPPRRFIIDQRNGAVTCELGTGKSYGAEGRGPPVGTSAEIQGLGRSWRGQQVASEGTESYADSALPQNEELKQKPGHRRKVLRPKGKLQAGKSHKGQKERKQAQDLAAGREKRNDRKQEVINQPSDGSAFLCFLSWIQVAMIKDACTHMDTQHPPMRITRRCQHKL